jgi:dephospho-CoA kinase
MSKKIKIGLTGGIGSGKSTVADFLRSKGIPVLDADAIAKDIMNSNDSVKEKLVAEFGKETYLNGMLNKEFLSSEIFISPKKIEKINSIVHPVVIKTLTYKMEKALGTNDVVLAEAALIFEAEMEDMFDYIFVITADEETRIARVMERSNLTRDEVARRIKNQIHEKEKIAAADFVFFNNEGKENLFENVLFVINLLKKS